MCDDEVMTVMMKLMMVMLDEMMNIRVLRWMIEEWVVMAGYWRNGDPILKDGD